MHLNLIQLAGSLGVEEAVVEGWVKNDGLPVILDRGRMLFDRAQVVEWAAARGLAARAGFLSASPDPGLVATRLVGWLRAGGIHRDVANTGVIPLLERVVSALPGATPEVCRLLAQRLRSPGGLTWAPVGNGLALPHLRTHISLGRDSGLLAMVFLREPVTLAEAPPDGRPVTRLLFFVAPSPRVHLELLAQLAAGLTRGGLQRLMLAAAPDGELLAAVAALEQPEGGTA